MRAVVWRGKGDVRVERVPDPIILNPRDAILRVTSTAICGSDLHLYGGFIPTMASGDILGHEFMGVVEEVGSSVQRLQRGDRVVVPFCIACGGCFFCRQDLPSLCENSNPNAHLAAALYGFTGAGLFGYSHMMGGYAGGQAEYVRVPFADVGALPLPAEITDHQALFLSDVFPTGYMAAEQCNIGPADTIAVWGCGPVGQFAIRSAHLLGARRVIAIDGVPERLRMAEAGGAETIDESGTSDVLDALRDRTSGRGPDACIDAVGMEADGHTLGARYDRVKQGLRLATDRSSALRQAILACRKGGIVSVPGVYGGFLDKFPFGAVFAKGLTIRTGQTHVHRYLEKLLALVQEGRIDPSFVVTHRLSLDEAPEAYEMFQAKRGGCIKVVLDPAALN